MSSRMKFIVLILQTVWEVNEAGFRFIQVCVDGVPYLMFGLFHCYGRGPRRQGHFSTIFSTMLAASYQRK